MRLLFCAFLILTANYLTAQSVSGTVINEKNKQPVAYVNIGIAGKNIGTVSDFEGKFKLDVAPEFDNDSLLFSCIGFSSYSIKIADFKNQKPTYILMNARVQELKEVIVRPRVYKEKFLGVTTETKFFRTGFGQNKLGYEAGILMEIKKTAYLKSVFLSIVECTYDTVFYRLNIYKKTDDLQFENVLSSPIYFKLPKERMKDLVRIDLTAYDIVVAGDFLVSVEFVKDLGPGALYFSASMTDKTYVRKTSQAGWEKGPVGISISVLADVEK